MGNNRCKKTIICSTNIDVTDFFTGPGEISRSFHYFSNAQDWYFSRSHSFSDYEGLKNVKPKVDKLGSKFRCKLEKWFGIVNFLLRNRSSNVVHLVFPSLALSILEIVLCRSVLSSYSLRVVGYDSFFRMNFLNFKKPLKFSTKIKLFARLVMHYFKELRIALLADEIFFVSNRCIRSFLCRFPWAYKKVFLLPLLPQFEENITSSSSERSVPNQELPNCGKKKLVVLGRYLSEWMLYDFHVKRSVLFEMQEHFDITVIGRGSKVMLNRYPELSGITPCEWLDDFDEYFKSGDLIVIYGPETASGVQTKLQKVILYGNCVFANSAIDVCDDLGHLMTGYKDVSELPQLLKTIHFNDPPFLEKFSTYSTPQISVYREIIL
jgi:hypothetical protein